MKREQQQRFRVLLDGLAHKIGTGGCIYHPFNFFHHYPHMLKHVEDAAFKLHTRYESQEEALYQKLEEIRKLKHKETNKAIDDLFSVYSKALEK